MINIIKIMVLMLVSGSLSASALLLRVQEEIPTIFVDGIQEELQTSFDNIIVRRMKKNNCINNTCLVQLSENLNVNNTISINVYQKNSSILIFEAKTFDFMKNKVNFKKSEFEVSTERKLYLFSKQFVKNIFKEEKRKVESKFFKDRAQKKSRLIKTPKRKFNFRNQHIRKKRNVGVGVGIGGANYLGLNLDWFITEHINIEISTIAYIPIVVGAQYFFSPRNNTSLYVGIHIMPIPDAPFYIPIGFQYMANNGFTVSLEGGILNLPEDVWSWSRRDEDRRTRINLPWAGLKMGYHF